MKTHLRTFSMKFITDKQTLEDLNMLGQYRSNSIFSFYNRTVTHGGEKKLEHFFASPLTCTNDINRMAVLFQFFQQKGIKFPLERREAEQLERRLSTCILRRS